MIFQGTYQSPFYRKLHQVLHDDLELHRRLDAADRPRPDAETLAAIDQLSADWFELGRLEAPAPQRRANAARQNLRPDRRAGPEPGVELASSP